MREQLAVEINGFTCFSLKQLMDLPRITFPDLQINFLTRWTRRNINTYIRPASTFEFYFVQPTIFQYEFLVRQTKSRPLPGFTFSTELRYHELDLILFIDVIKEHHQHVLHVYTKTMTTQEDPDARTMKSTNFIFDLKNEITLIYQISVNESKINLSCMFNGSYTTILSINYRFHLDTPTAIVATSNISDIFWRMAPSFCYYASTS